jgi:endonuclease-3
MTSMADDTKARARKIVARLKKEYPDAGCSLRYKTAHQLLVATILSAQTTDEQVNKITPGLFRKYKSIEAFAGAKMSGLEQDIKSIGLYRNKAKSIKQSAMQILHEFGGEVPDNMDDLVRLSGVGRKTAGVVLGEWFGTAEGIVVDTHVKRISKLLGLTRQTDPNKIERNLMEIIPKRDWIILTHLLIDHGRAVCIARSPRCEVCVLNKLCPSAFKV